MLKGTSQCAPIAQMNSNALPFPYEELRDRLLSLSLKYQRSYAEAEDAVSETMVQILEKAERFEKRSKFTTWAFAVCINKNLEILRRKKTLVKHMNLYFRNLATTLRPESGEPSMLRQDFRNALEKLDERERSVFLLTVYEEMPQKEIADVLGTSVSNIKVILHRGRKKLLNYLADYREGSAHGL